jgi:hypothetical protein
MARVAAAQEQRCGRPFNSTVDIYVTLSPKGGPTLRRALDLAPAEWRLLQVPQVRFEVSDDGAVRLLVDAERPLVRKGNYRKPHGVLKRQVAPGG